MTKGELYTPLSQIDHESPQYTNYDGNSKDGPTYSIQGKRLSICFYIVTTVLILSNVIWSGIFLSRDGVSSACTLHEEETQSKDQEPPLDYAAAPVIPVQYKPFFWNTMYSSEDQTVQDEMWESIVWTHGLIAVDQEWAKSQNWPETMARPNNGSQAVYLLEAYHEVHCLRVMRQMLKESLESPTTLSEHQARHIDHCFDSLLQVVMCNADSTPLYTWGTTKVGDGQILIVAWETD
uniref:Cyclochlorotine biosynthesis protein O n=1 Tax=Talaromyces marneffei PM1 TaxID=1077442 RepID=A0A093V894_TALMA